MEIIVLDTSVLIKPLIREEGAEKVKKILFLKDTFKLSVLVPEIFKYEFFNGVTREKNGLVAKKAYDLLAAKQFSVVPIEYDLMESASRLMQKYQGVSYYDAAYHALAIAYDAFFITADEKYFQKTSREGHIKLLKNYKI